MRRLPAGKKIRGQMLIDAWPGAVGEAVACKTSALSFAEGTLHIWVRDSVWAQHIALHKKMIISNLNGLVRTRMLQDLRFRVGGAPPPSENFSHSATVTPEWRRIPLDPQDLWVVEAALDGIALEPEMKKSLRKFLINQKKLVRYYFAQGCRPCRFCGLPAGKTAGEDLCRCCRLQRSNRCTN
ncbi:MAG: hypothetical protein DDT21_00849 [Syntrophomonadaceae bacterium]|nr:hypothetical protein [Bacillota bacterium]